MVRAAHRKGLRVLVGRSTGSAVLAVGSVERPMVIVRLGASRATGRASKLVLTIAHCIPENIDHGWGHAI